MAVSRYTDFVRAIISAYDTIATEEGIAAPTIQFSRRYVTQIHAPPRILLVDADGDVDAPLRLSAGYVAAVSFAIDAHIWGIEPTIANGTSETEVELLRIDARDPMIDRYINVVKSVAPGRSEGGSIRLNPGGGSALVNGELAIVRYTYTRGVEKARVYDRLGITPAPRDPDRPNGDTGNDYTITTPLAPTR